MKIQTKIQKWGNGLALRVGGLMRDLPQFKEGTVVEVEVTEEGFLVKKLKSKKCTLFPYSEAEIINGLTRELAHADCLANPLSDEIELS